MNITENKLESTMKQIFSFLVMLALTGMVAAQTPTKPVMTFENVVHDFGSIAEDGGNVTYTFQFKNEGATPLVIHNIGSGTQEENSLFTYPLTGHYRVK